LEDGFIIINGKEIKQNEDTLSITACDIAPTILYLLGFPIPEDMDGNVNLDAITDSFKMRLEIEKLKSYNYLNRTIPIKYKTYPEEVSEEE